MTDFCCKYLESGWEVCTLFLDLEKALDSVSHRSLLLVSQHLEVHPYVLKWLCSYLTNQVQIVLVNGECSSDVHVVSGVSQSSVLGPLLFLLYVNSVTNVVLSIGAKIILYADDILHLKPIKDGHYFVFLQEDINSLPQWFDCKHLLFNPDKCIFMIVSRKWNVRHSPVLFLNGHTCS